MPCSFFDVNTAFLCKLPEQPSSNFCFFHDLAFASASSAAVADEIKNVATQGPCTITGVRFDQLELQGATFEDSVTFEHCTFIRCALRDLTFRGSFTLRECGYEDRLLLEKVTFKAAASLYRLSCPKQGTHGVSFVATKFMDAVDFRSTTFVGSVSFGGCEFHAAATFDDSHWGHERHDLSITNCTFSSASFERMTFDGERIYLKDPQCRQMTFAHSVLKATYLEFFFGPCGGLVNFEASIFAGAKPVCVVGKLTGTLNFKGVDLTGATLRGDMAHVILRDAILDGADLRDAEGARYDHTSLRGARLAPDAQDFWSQLRRSYTGPMFTLHLVLLLAFLAPLAIEAAWLHQVFEAQRLGRNVTQELRQRADDAEKANDRATAARLRAAAGLVNEAFPCFEQAPKCIERPLAVVLVGLDKHPVGRGWLNWWPFVLVVIVYNICRAVLTFPAARMRDDEKQSGYSPSLRAYQWMRRPHRFMEFVVYLVGGLFLLRVIDLLFFTPIFVLKP